MLLSIIIPVFNTKDYLKQCLESIASQNFENYEVIIIDDGSTDGSDKICDDFCVGCKKAKVIHQDNKGPSAARNRGIEEATGDWVWFVDSDDLIADGALSALEERLSFIDCDLFAFQYTLMSEDGDDFQRIFFRHAQEKITFKREADIIWNYITRLLNYSDGWEAWTRLFKRKVIIDNDIRFTSMDTVFAEDICFLIEYMMCATSEVMLVNYLYFYRQRSTSITRTIDQATIIPRLFNLLEHNYKEANRLKKGLIKKEFYKISFELLRNQILKLDRLSIEEIKVEILAGEQNRVIGRSIKRIKKNLIKNIEDSRKLQQN